MSDRTRFNEFVYTSLDSALQEIKKRRSDMILKEKIRKILNDDIPKVFLDSLKIVLFRQLATPNYELIRFLNISHALDINPLIWEYHDDKFTPNNDYKKSLGKMGFYYGDGKKGGARIERKNIIDFNSSNGEKISSLKTMRGESLIEFHHNLIAHWLPRINISFFDSSEWMKRHGQFANKYYKDYLVLFLANGILFENFVLEDKQEYKFTKEIFLPAFLFVQKKMGIKPLIVALEPTETESEDFWMCYPPELKNHIFKNGEI